MEGGGGKARLWLRGCSRDGLGGGELLETEKTVRMRAPHHCRIQEEDRGRAGEGGGGSQAPLGPSGQPASSSGVVKETSGSRALARRAAAKRGKKGEGTRFGGFAKILK